MEHHGRKLDHWEQSLKGEAETTAFPVAHFTSKQLPCREQASPPHTPTVTWFHHRPKAREPTNHGWDPLEM